MARTRKTRRQVADEPVLDDANDIDDDDDDAENEEPVETKPVAKTTPAKPVMMPVQKKPEEFTVILQNASSLTLAGRKFVKNEPTKVPMEHLKLFQTHGWFRVIVPKTA